MADVTLEQIHEDIQGLKMQIAHLSRLVEEDFELSDEVLQEIRESRARPPSGYVSHEEMRRELG